MAKQVINYEEDIFFLNLLLKNLSEGLKLEIDPDFFQDKIHEEILFLSSTIDQIFKALTMNSVMYKRFEYLKNLQRLIQQMISLLTNLQDNQFTISANLGSHFSEYQSICVNHQSYLITIKERLKDISQENTDEENIVSEEEYKHLFYSDDQSETIEK